GWIDQLLPRGRQRGIIDRYCPDMLPRCIRMKDGVIVCCQDVMKKVVVCGYPKAYTAEIGIRLYRQARLRMKDTPRCRNLVKVAIRRNPRADGDFVDGAFE